MSTYDWVFLDHPILELQDIEATLTNADVDSNRSAIGYVIRLAPDAYRNATTQRHEILWSDVSLRLRHLQLVLLPNLPTINEIVTDSRAADVVSTKIMYLNPMKIQNALLPVPDDCVQQIRQLDLQRVAHSHEANALLSVQGGHFILPSGAHTSHFFRLAECLSSLENVDTIAYWAGRNLQQNMAGQQIDFLLLLVDHPSMLVLATRLSQLLPSVRTKIEAIKEYPDTSVGDHRLTEQLGKWFSSVDAVHCIVGVSSTGTLTNLIKRASTANQRTLSFSIIYATTATDNLPALCNLEIEDYAHYRKEEACKLCSDADRATPFHIDPSRYFLHERRREPIPLPPPLYTDQRQFLEMYGQIDGVLKVHIDDPNDETGRHHAFYIDVSELLACETFAEELKAHIHQIKPAPDLIVIPPHHSGRKIAALIRANFEIPVYLHRNLRLNLSDPEEKDLAAALDAAKALLIMDDLSFTGRRLHTFNCSLREAKNAFKCPPYVTFFPLISVPESLESWGQFKRGLCGKHPGQQIQDLRSLYTIQLPHWTTDNCPWCVEARQIERLPPFSEDDSDERGNVLSDKDAGLYGNGWINVPASEKVPTLGDKSPLLSEGSSAIQVLFACASAVQQARSRKERPLNPRGFPLSHVLNGGVIRDFTNETLFVTALLRSLINGEVSDDFRQHVTLLAEKAAQNEPHNRWALRELLLSITRGLGERIPEETRSQVYAIVGFSGYLTSDSY